jgi:hypothetical protein
MDANTFEEKGAPVIEAPEPEPDDEARYDDPPDRLHHEHLKDDNERRIRDIAEHTQGQVKLDHAFDTVKLVTYIKHLLLDAGLLDRADFDYEGQRSKLLDITEREIAEFEKKAAEAMRLQKLGIAPPGMPGQAGPIIANPGGAPH